MTTFLKDLVDVNAFQRYLEEGYISEREHENDSTLRVYSYTPKTQFSGFWTTETRLARGLMLRYEGSYAEAEVVGRGLPKFFTVEQATSDWGATKLVDDDEGVVIEDAAELPWDMPANVANKMNGALILAYKNPNGTLSGSTKGSFGSQEANIANRLFADRYSPENQERFFEITEGETALFEIITPERPHPVDYGTLEDLFFLGTVRNSDGFWSPAVESHPLMSLGFKIVENMELNTLREAVLSEYRENTEGLVVTVDVAATQYLYKVKPVEYLALRKNFYALEQSDFTVTLATYTGEDFLALDPETFAFPAGMRNVDMKRQQLREKFYEPFQDAMNAANADYSEIRGQGELPSRAAFAENAKKSNKQLQELFSAYDDELNGGTKLARAVGTRVLRDSKN